VVADDPVAFAAALERAAGKVADVDGAGFYRRQRAELDARVRRGLEAIGYQRHEALA
jgi:hypothetical protein